MAVRKKPKQKKENNTTIYRRLEAEKKFVEEEMVRCKKDLYDAKTGMEMEVQKRTRELESETARLKELIRSKDEFIRMTNHELRTPLDVIRGNVDMIIKGEAGEISDETREYLRDVLTGADRLTGIVNDMLDVARVEAGRMKFELDDVDIREVLEQLVKEFKPVAKDKNITLDLKASDSLPKMFSDKAKIFQILDNLIGNSMKFTPAGGAITIFASEEDDMVMISVSDTGIGIKPDDQKKLFKKFPQIDTSEIATKKGTGLGLNLVWQLIHKLGGQIWADSKGRWKGAIFSFQLPKAGTKKAQSLKRFHEVLNREEM